ncbi:MAG: threonine--tRNA ligase [Candidatus Nanoarchaeia archaeon]|nr:threonine--tRNA ligase [Candidatus Nanoarchaeia archaeon]
MIEIEFPNKEKKKFEENVSALDIARDISEGFARNVLVAKFNDKLIDLTRPITTSGSIFFYKFDDLEGKDTFWHSSAHVLAYAMMKVNKDIQLTIGPSIDNGFYYDIYPNNAFNQEDFVKIEEEFRKIVKEDLPFERKEISKSEALELFKDNKYKIEIIKELPENETITIYKLGEFIDLCRGPHLPSSKYVKSFKVMSTSGAYWRADSSNDQLQRVYGVSYQSNKELNDYLELLEEAKRRDHKILGRQMDLFSFSEYAPGMPFFHNKGMILWNELMNFWNKLHKEDGYEIIKTPIMLSRQLWEYSGHWEHYQKNMYTTKVDDQDYAIKPMNCPGGILVYKTKSHSYKEFPIKSGELGLVHRHELSGVINGLFRVRCFHQDDAHIFMRQDQIKEQILGVLNLIEKTYSIFGLEYNLELSTRPENGSIGSDENWEAATKGLEEALVAFGKGYKLNPGDGAFYGPKIDVHIKDSLGRSWQCGTIQLDMNLPERFDLSYIDENNQKIRPVMIHRVIYGSIERFIGILIEHFAGKFPLWINPVQIKILNIADRHLDYCEKVSKELKDAGLRVEEDYESRTLSNKIRIAQSEKVNYIMIIGDKDLEENTVSVRDRDNKTVTYKIEDFIDKLKNDVLNYM